MPCGPGDSSSVISVKLDEDEDVRWCWTHYPGGRSVVTGYEIIKKEPGVEGGEFSFERAVTDLLWGESKKNPEPQRERASLPKQTRARHPVGFLSSISRHTN